MRRRFQTLNGYPPGAVRTHAAPRYGNAGVLLRQPMIRTIGENVDDYSSNGADVNQTSHKIKMSYPSWWMWLLSPVGSLIASNVADNVNDAPPSSSVGGAINNAASGFGAGFGKSLGNGIVLGIGLLIAYKFFLQPTKQE